MEIVTSTATLPSTNPTKINRGDFPANFIIGAGGSSYQVEGGVREGGRGISIWDALLHRNPGVSTDGSNGDMAADSYHLFKEDVKQLKLMGLDAYRLSIAWPRILPSGTVSAGINREGIKYYNDLIDELLANGIEPWVSILHFDLPQILQDEYGGFLSSRIVKDFVDYAELCFWEFGDRVKYWITINEPWSFSSFTTSYFSTSGTGADINVAGRSTSLVKLVDSDRAAVPTRSARLTAVSSASYISGDAGIVPYVVTHNQLLAHAAAVELYRTKFQKFQEGKIGMTLVSEWFEPWDEKSEADAEAAIRAFDFLFGWFMDPLTTGDYPKIMRELVGERLPRFKADESKQLKGSYDFVGVNYYTGAYVTSAPKPAPGTETYDTDAQVAYRYERHGIPIGPLAASSWLYIYPEGIRKLLVYLKRRYNNPLVYVTENGVDQVNEEKWTLSEARVDPTRTKYLQDHLFNIRAAISEGANVKGYFVWSLLDNYEFRDGFMVRFGLIFVNFRDNFMRYPKESALWLMTNFNKKYKHGWFKRSLPENDEEYDEEPRKKLRF